MTFLTGRMSPLQDLLTFMWNDFIFGFGLNNELLYLSFIPGLGSYHRGWNRNREVSIVLLYSSLGWMISWSKLAHMSSRPPKRFERLESNFSTKFLLLFWCKYL